jgi:hypothetical protein
LLNTFSKDTDKGALALIWFKLTADPSFGENSHEALSRFSGLASGDSITGVAPAGFVELCEQDTAISESTLIPNR